MTTMTYDEALAGIGNGDAVLVFDGYSGLGYENQAAVAKRMEGQIINAAKGGGPVHVVAGATDDGIGMCYGIAAALRATLGVRIRLIGIVSSEALVDGQWGRALSKKQEDALDALVVVDDPKGTWQVLDDSGRSLMVEIGLDAAKREASVGFSFIGGGAVAKSELEQLSARLRDGAGGGAVSVSIVHGQGDFAPNKEKAAAKERALAAKGKTPLEIRAEIDGVSFWKEGDGSVPEPIGSCDILTALKETGLPNGQNQLPEQSCPDATATRPQGV